jgi:ABC-type multidrug transport system fused ATPase/permease subunit
MLAEKKNLIIAGAVAAVLIIIVFVVVATIFSWWPVVVDITLVFAALASLVLLGALIYAVFSLTRTVLRIRDELIPTLASLKTTSATVRETVGAASSFGVQPVVRTASAVLGAGEIATVILGRGQARSRSEKRQRRRQELEREMEREEQEQTGLMLEARNGHR